MSTTNEIKPERTAAYRRLADRLKEELAAGVYAPGVQLPTEADLVVSEGTSRHTVRQALRELEADGLVYRVSGRGTFPVPRTPRTRSVRINGAIDDMLSIVESTQLLVLSGPTIVTAESDARLLLLPTDEVAQFRALRIDQGIPFSLFSASIAPDVVALLPRDEFAAGIPKDHTIAGVVGRVLDRPPAVIEQTIEAAACPGEVAGYLGLEPGDPCLAIDRIYFDRDGQPLEVVRGFHNSDRYNYHICLSQRR